MLKGESEHGNRTLHINIPCCHIMGLQATLLILLGCVACGYGQVAYYNLTCRDTWLYIKSPNYYQPYPNNLNWTYVGRGEPGMQFFLTFNAFELEEPNSNGECVDYCQIYDGKVLIFESCGTYDPPMLITGNEFTIRFVTNGAIQKKGFAMTASKSCYGCRFTECTKQTRTCEVSTCNSQTMNILHYSKWRFLCEDFWTYVYCYMPCDACPEGNLGLCKDVIAAKSAQDYSCSTYANSACSATEGVGIMHKVLRCYAAGAHLPEFAKCYNPCCCSPITERRGIVPAVTCNATGVKVVTEPEIYCN